jgi:hypothetical protein
MTIKNKFELGQTVYLITDKEQEARIVTGIKIGPGDLIYQLACGKDLSEHYDFEISEEADVLQSMK